VHHYVPDHRLHLPRAVQSLQQVGALQAGRCCIATAGGSEKISRGMEKENQRARGVEKENQTAGKDKRALDRWKFKGYEGAEIWNNKLQTMASKT